jgi:hypothetical protein
VKTSTTTSTESDNLLESQPLDELIAWLLEDVLDDKQHSGQAFWHFLLGFFAVSTAIIYNSPYYPLTGKFTEEEFFAPFEDSDDNDDSFESAKLAIYHSLALISCLANTALGLVEAKRWYQDTTSTQRKYNVARPLNTYPTATNILFTSLSLPYALSQLYSTVLGFENKVCDNTLYFLAAASWAGPFAFRISAQKRFNYEMQNFIKIQFSSSSSSTGIEIERKKLKILIKQTEDVVKNWKHSARPAWLQSHAKQLMPRYASGRKEQQADDFLRFIFVDIPNQNPTATSSSGSATGPNFGENVARGVGGTIATIGSIITYSLVQGAIIYLCDLWGIEDRETRDALKFTAGVLAFVPSVSITATFTQRAFGELYQSYQKSRSASSGSCAPLMDNPVPALSLLLGAIATLPSAYLANVAAGDAVPKVVSSLFAGTVFIGYTATRSLSTTDLLRDIQLFFKNFHHTNDVKLRWRFLEAIEKVANVLDKMPADKIQALHEKYATAVTMSGINIPSGDIISSSPMSLTSYGTTDTGATDDLEGGRQDTALRPE